MGLNIGVSVNADVAKLQALDRQMKQLTRTYQELSKSAKQSGSAFGQSLPSGQMPMAGSVVPPSGFAMMSHLSPHSGMAGSRMSPVMYGPAFNAQMHTMMPGRLPHQYGATQALTQLQQKSPSTPTLSSTYTTGSMTRQDAQKMTQSLDHLAKVLQSSISAPKVSTGTIPSGNPFVALAAQSTVLRAQSGFGAITLPQGTANRIAVSQALMAPYAASNNASSGMAGTHASTLGRFVRGAMRLARVPYTGEMLGGGAAEALGVGGTLAGLGVTAGAGLGVGALLWGGHKVMQGYQTYQQTANPLSNLYHSVMPGSSFNSFYNSIVGQGNSVGAANPMKAQVAQILASTGGSAALKSVGSVFQGAVGLGYGVNGATTFASRIAQLQQLGLTSGLSATTTNSRLMMMLGNASVQSGMGGRTPQLIDALTSLTQSLDQQRTTPPNASALLSMMTTLSRPINGKYLQSTQGQNGANILSSVNSSLTNPGGGPAGQLLMYSWLTKGTQMTPWQEIALAHEGLTGKFNGQGPTNLQRIVQGAMSSFAGLKNGVKPTGPVSNATQMALDQIYGMLNLKSPQQAQLFLGQFTHNGHFSMANLNAEQNWWQNTFHKSPNASWAPTAAQLYNATKYSQFSSVASELQTGGVVLTTQEQKQLAQLKNLNPNSSTFKSTASALRKEMGSQMLNTPMLTATDNLTKAINQNQNAWSQIGKYIQPIATDLNKIAGAIPNIPKVGKNSRGGNIGSAPSYDQYGMLTSYDYIGHQSNQFAVMNMMFAHPNAVASFLNLSAPGSGSSGGGSSLPVSMPGASSHSLGIKAGNIKSFISKVMPYAKSASSKTGLPVNYILAQWGLETGFGSKTSYAMYQNNNLAGIKPDPKEGLYAGKDSTYAGFNSLNSFVNAYASFYKNNSNYNTLMQDAAKGYSASQLAGVIGSSHYATDPQYGAHIVQALQEVVGALKTMSASQLSPGLTQFTNPNNT